MEMEGEEDLYVVLGIEGGGPEVSQLEVRKAYRTRALLCHPDKRRKDAAAAALEFDKLQKAYEVLGDEQGRKAYNELWRLRRSRLDKEKEMSHKRQKMMQDLRDRERAFEIQKNEKREEEEASKRLKAEIARIRAMRAKKGDTGGLHFSLGRESNGQPPTQGSAKPQASGLTPAQVSEMEKTLKASWTCEEGGGGGYTASRLNEIFEEFGTVEDVVIRQSKSRKKGSALVVMGSKEAAVAATQRQSGDLANPLLVVPVLASGKMSADSVSAQATPVHEAKVNPVVGSGYHSYEGDILQKMRVAAERARIIKEMQEADAKAS